MAVVPIETFDVVGDAVFDQQSPMPGFRIADDQALGGVAHHQTADAEEVGIPHQGTAVVDVPVPADDRARAGAIRPDFRPVVLGAAGGDGEFLVENAPAPDEQPFSGAERPAVDVREILPGRIRRRAGVGVAARRTVDVVSHGLGFTGTGRREPLRGGSRRAILAREEHQRMPRRHGRTAGRSHPDLRGTDARRIGLDGPCDRLFGPRRHGAQFVDRLAQAAHARRQFETDDHLLGARADVADGRGQLLRTPGAENGMLLPRVADLQGREPGVLDLQVVDQSAETADHQRIVGRLREPGARQPRPPAVDIQGQGQPVPPGCQPVPAARHHALVRTHPRLPAVEIDEEGETSAFLRRIHAELVFAVLDGDHAAAGRRLFEVHGAVDAEPRRQLQIGIARHLDAVRSRT